MGIGTADWIAVDWGTSNLRAWGIGSDGEVVFSCASDRGMARLERSAYPAALHDLLGDEIFTAEDLTTILVCGMAGARQGWLEAPYLEVPADLSELAAAAVSPTGLSERLAAHILPGICQRIDGAEDVMRGEETQLLGLATMHPNFSGLVVMPGTHSKWVALAGRRIERFSTSMTGELFETLSAHSVLRHSLAGNEVAEERDAGFEAGLDTGLEAPQSLTARLFSIRAGSLLSGHTPGWCAGFLSGILIGTEIGGQRDWIGGSEIPLVGSTALCDLYARGFAKLGVKTRVINATEATLAGLRAARFG